MSKVEGWRVQKIVNSMTAHPIYCWNYSQGVSQGSSPSVV